MPYNIRLVSAHLNNNSIVRSIELDDAFATCTNKEDGWKLGLVYFVDRVLYSHDANSKVDMYLFSLVEREKDFFKYLLVRSPLRGHSLDWTRTGPPSNVLLSLEKRNVKKDGVPKYTTEAKYTVYSYGIALQY